MNQDTIQKLENSINNLKDKKARLYFLAQDTKGNAIASVAMIYRMALTLLNAGYNPIILHEKNDYTGVSKWLGDEYMTIPHRSLEAQNLEISPEDFIILPELYGYIMEQITNLPCAKIVLAQSHDYIFETLQPGQTWGQLGFLKCITTSDHQKKYLETIMKNISYDVINPLISENFKKQELPPKPIIAIHSRDQRDTINLIKGFYVKFPQYRWVTFRDMRGLTESEFANVLNDTFLSVWIDPISSFGTYPIESMKAGVPVIGLIPNMVPDWMSDENGIWCQNKNQILDFVVDFLHNWLEDNISEELYTEMEKTAKQFSNKALFAAQVKSLFSQYLYTRQTSFEEQLNKLKPIETI